MTSQINSTSSSNGSGKPATGSLQTPRRNSISKTVKIEGVTAVAAASLPKNPTPAPRKLKTLTKIIKKPSAAEATGPASPSLKSRALQPTPTVANAYIKRREVPKAESSNGINLPLHDSERPELRKRSSSSSVVSTGQLRALTVTSPYRKLSGSSAVIARFVSISNRIELKYNPCLTDGFNGSPGSAALFAKTYPLQKELEQTKKNRDSQEKRKAALKDSLSKKQESKLRVCLKKIARFDSEIKSIEEKLNELQAKCRVDLTHDAEIYLRNGMVPNKPRDRILEELILEKMAQICVQRGKITAIKEGTGGVYLLEFDEKLQFVFKPVNEAPGMPGNKKGHAKVNQTEDGNFCGFPAGQGPFRSYASSVFEIDGPKRTLVALSTEAGQPPQLGLLIQYIPNLCSLEDVSNIVKHFLEQREFSSPGKDVDMDKKVEKFPELIKLSLEGLPSNVSSAPLSKYGIWKHISQESIEKIMAEDLRKPNFDRNPDNLLLVKRSKPDEKGALYDVIGIDEDQVYPNKWQIIEEGAWFGSIVGDIPLRESKILREAIEGFKIDEDYRKLHQAGIPFDTEGEGKNITMAFHLAANVALELNATMNQLGELLFVAGGRPFPVIYDLYRKAFPLKQDDFLSKYQQMCNSNNGWKLFASLIEASLKKKMDRDAKKVAAAASASAAAVPPVENGKK